MNPNCNAIPKGKNADCRIRLFPRTVQSADLNSGKAKKFKNLQMDFQEWNKGSDRDTTLDKLNEKKLFNGPKYIFQLQQKTMKVK